MWSSIFDCITGWDVIALLLGAVLSAIATLILIIFFRPKICIGVPELKRIEVVNVNGNKVNRSIIKINVVNCRCHSDAINLKIEAAFVLNDKTYHLDFDRFDFVMLPRLNKSKKNKETPYCRTFHALKINDYTLSILDNDFKTIDQLIDYLKLNINGKDLILRVRVHANHSFTGFGKAFVAKFKFPVNEFISYEGQSCKESFIEKVCKKEKT
ncbi:MAG: hypothetical protein PHG67_14345 [Bacteroidales bacterium]|nr:hypothetical protein [Bacteroidales bacterium]